MRDRLPDWFLDDDMSEPLSEVNEEIHGEVGDAFGDFIDEEINADLERRDRQYEPVSREVMRRAADLGVYEVLLPEGLGGRERGFVRWVLALRALAYFCEDFAWTMLLSAEQLKINFMYEHCEQRHLDRYVEPVSKGERTMGSALWDDTEYLELQTTVERADGAWVIDGWKGMVMGGTIADVFLVFAREPSSNDVMAFFVDEDEAGLSRELVRPCGLRTGGFCELELDEVRVSDDAVLFEQDAVSWASLVYRLERYHIAAITLGRMERSFEKCIDSVSERNRGGKPLTQHFHIENELGEIRANIRSTRQALLAGLSETFLGDASEAPGVSGAALPDLLALRSSLKQGRLMMRMHGASGYKERTPWPRFYRDALANLCGSTPPDLLLNELGQDAIRRRKFEREFQ